MHPSDLYERAGAWCWINGKYEPLRLWLHYFYVIIAEFGTVIIYALLFIILQKRVRQSFYSNSGTAMRARSAAKLIIAYPIAYVVCTLPLVKARLTGMAGRPVSFLELTVAGCMITSNGWVDVVLYSLTRRALLFGPEVGDDQTTALDTFIIRPDHEFGTTTFIEATRGTHSRGSVSKRQQSEGVSHSRHGSTEELFARRLQGVKAETTVMVRSETVELEPIKHDWSEADLAGAAQPWKSSE
jgi:hypothetical protein